MARRVGFYLGSLIFFVGLLMLALGVSKAFAGALDLMALVELVTGLILIIAGSRGIRSVQR